jgi:hypothetical protein
MEIIESCLSELIHVTDIFSADTLFLDTNRDGYPDDLGLKILIAPGLFDPYVWVWGVEPDGSPSF